MNTVNAWFTRNLGDALLADEALAHIKSLFLSAHAQARYADDMAIFIRHESAGRIHCEVNVYFSPSAANVAQAVKATPCNKPSVNDLSLLAGSEESWRILLAEQK